MDKEQFDVLVDTVLETSARPPEKLFAGGYEDWHCRARLAHFLAMPELNRPEAAKELFHSIIDVEPDSENAEDIEEKTYALQHLSQMEREANRYEEALNYINIALETAEESDFLYKYILRGELWADRWNLLHLMNRTEEAEAEADERIEFFRDIPVAHNSYLYYGYRFKAQLAAERGVVLVAKDFMHMALHAMDIPPINQEKLKTAFEAQHENISWIMAEIDKATPNPDNIHWDI